MFNVLKRLRGSNLKARLLNPRDAFFDQLLGVKTFGYKQYDQYDLQNPNWRGDYMPTHYKDIFTLLREANVGKESVLVDFGSGLGRVVFTAAYLGAKHCTGVEFDLDLHKAAETNRTSSKFADRVSFVHQDATLYTISDNANFFFFYNPFGSAIMSKVIKLIEESIEAAPRIITIIYFNSRFPQALHSSTQFNLKKEWPEVKERYAAQFWSNSPA